MAICYEENNSPWRGGGTGFDPSRVNANRLYLEHYGNYLLLKFMLMRGTTAEKAQASLELVKCERKLAWCEALPQFDRRRLEPELCKLKAQWAPSMRLT